MNSERRRRDRRTEKDRRYHDANILAPDRRIAEDRRSGIDRRTEWPAVCIICGKVCEGQWEWSQGASTIDGEIECRSGICIDCSKKKYPQFYK